MKAYYTGVPVGLTSGHYCAPEDRGTTPWSAAGCPLVDWHPEMQGLKPPGLAWEDRPRGNPETEGEFAHLVLEGWTLLAAWDNSGDKRGGSTASFALEGEHTGEEALHLARNRWPAVFRRIEQHLGRPVIVRPAVVAVAPRRWR